VDTSKLLVSLVVAQSDAADMMANGALRRGMSVWLASPSLLDALCEATEVKATSGRRLARMCWLGCLPVRRSPAFCGASSPSNLTQARAVCFDRPVHFSALLDERQHRSPGT